MMDLLTSLQHPCLIWVGIYLKFSIREELHLKDFLIMLKSKKYTRLVPAQDVNFFYMRSNLNALQNCALNFSTNFQFIFTFKDALHDLVIELLFNKLAHSFVAIELLTFAQM